MGYTTGAAIRKPTWTNVTRIPLSVPSRLIYTYIQHDFIKLLGILPPTSILGLLGPLLLVAILFLGPLTQLFFEEALPFQKNFNYQEDFVELFWSLFGLRNFVVVSSIWFEVGRKKNKRIESWARKAPITEEFVFRACVISTLYHAGFSSSYLVFISPMYFGFGKGCE